MTAQSIPLVVGSLLGCCWLMALQTTPLAALFTKVDGGFSVGMLQADNGAYNTFGGPCH